MFTLKKKKKRAGVNVQFSGLFGETFGQRGETLVAAADHCVQTGALRWTPQHRRAAVLIVTCIGERRLLECWIHCCGVTCRPRLHLWSHRLHRQSPGQLHPGWGSPSGSKDSDSEGYRWRYVSSSANPRARPGDSYSWTDWPEGFWEQTNSQLHFVNLWKKKRVETTIRIT